MTLIHVIIEAQPVLNTFSPVEALELIMSRCKDNGELPIDVYTTEVK